MRPAPPPPRPSGKRALALAGITVGAALALFIVVSVVLNVVRAARVRRAIDQAMLDAHAPRAATLPATPSPETSLEGTPPPAAEPAPARTALTARELARQSLPATVSLHCQDSLGSGFFVDPDLILTNAHVLCPAG